MKIPWSTSQRLPQDNATNIDNIFADTTIQQLKLQGLIQVVQELSHARDIDTVAEIVRTAARRLTGADGATFILREGDLCHYADEDAISPLWKGLRFPMNACISGWVMENALPAKIRDIYLDERIPINAYRPTFVKSLAVVPIRKNSPVGAIGNYWADYHDPTDTEMLLLQALADSTSIAIENVNLYAELQKKIGELEESNFELNCLTWAASHDLQEPLRTITMQIELLEQENKDELNMQAITRLHTAIENAARLRRLFNDLLVHTTQTNRESNFKNVNLAQVLESVLDDLKLSIDEAGARITADALPAVTGNVHLLACLLRNALSNALKFHRPGVAPVITISTKVVANEHLVSITDNGIGIQLDFQGRVFGMFQRAHPQDSFPGSGIGLATCKKIVLLHGGRIWTESAAGGGTEFCFTLPVT